MISKSLVALDVCGTRCVCCTVRSDLIGALVELLDKGTQFDAVLIETTGLADPAPVASTFYTDSEVSEYYKIDSILTLVDCKHVMTHLEEQKPDGVVNEAVQQVSDESLRCANGASVLAWIEHNMRGNCLIRWCTKCRRHFFAYASGKE